MDLPPAEYSLLCEVTDLDSKKSGKKKEKVIIRDFSTQNLNLSDLLLLNRHDVTKEILKTIEEQFSELLADSTNFLIAALEIYSRRKNSNFKISYSVIDFRNHIIKHIVTFWVYDMLLEVRDGKRTAKECSFTEIE